MPPIDLAEKVARTLRDADTPLWFPKLTSVLAQAEWERLKNKSGITSENYSTARMILKNPCASRAIALFLSAESKKENPAGEKISVELLPKDAADKYRKVDVKFYSFEEIFAENYSDEKEIINSLRDALDIIRLVPSIFSTVSVLAKSIHLIKPETDDYDTSFSEPNISFSIFVSVPRKNNLINSLRVAEAIIHEAMHLKLTLIEKIAPLVAPGSELYYSPWKDEFRTPQGVLHALYVFRVIDRFFAELSDGRFNSPQALSHGIMRRREINGQIETIKDITESRELTTLGKIFVRRLVEKIN